MAHGMIGIFGAKSSYGNHAVVIRSKCTALGNPIDSPLTLSHVVPRSDKGELDLLSIRPYLFFCTGADFAS